MKRLAVFLLVLGMSQAHADGGRLAVPENAKWKEECGSCHITFPPKLLTADNWQKMMGGLDKHFGANAALDAKENQEILDFLTRNAASGARYSSASLRISDTPWFKREHREVSAKEWGHSEVKSRANCTACHINTANIGRGIWSERDIRMPGGRRGEDDDN